MSKTYLNDRQKSFVLQIQKILSDYRAIESTDLKLFDVCLNDSSLAIIDLLRSFSSMLPSYQFYQITSGKDSYLLACVGLEAARVFYLENLHKPDTDYVIEVVEFLRWVRVREVLYTDLQFLKDKENGTT